LCLARDGDDGPYRPQLSYGEMWERAMALARGLAIRVEAPGERLVLGVMLRNRPEWIAGELAARVRGYPVGAMSPDDAHDRLAVVLARARPGCVICEDADAERLERLAPEVRWIVACGEGGAGGRRLGLEALIAEGAGASAPPPAPRAESDPYAVLFTSGS